MYSNLGEPKLIFPNVALLFPLFVVGVKFMEDVRTCVLFTGKTVHKLCRIKFTNRATS